MVKLIDYYQWSEERRLTYGTNTNTVDNKEYFSMYPAVECQDTHLLNNDITVYFDSNMNGGGTSFASIMPAVIRDLYPDTVFNNCFEWCSGPGFIGFDILSHGICNNLWLGDIYKPCITSIEKTIDHLPEKYKGKVEALHLHCIDVVPDTLKFDLVVANPPHWNTIGESMASKIKFLDRTSADSGWEIHKNFFRNIKKNLAPGGRIFLIEASYASGPDSFKEFIEQSGLKIIRVFWEESMNDFYYLEIQHKDD
jgi:methylase of polypeptide subunit release factors